MQIKFAKDLHQIEKKLGKSESMRAKYIPMPFEDKLGLFKEFLSFSKLETAKTAAKVFEQQIEPFKKMANDIRLEANDRNQRALQLISQVHAQVKADFEK